MWELASELFGTFLLVLLGDGVVANVGLAPRLAGSSYPWLTVTIGWCFAVAIACYICPVSNHLNPAVTLGLAVRKTFPWSKVLPFWAAQMAGGFLGALGVFLVYRDGLVAAGMPNVWTSGPGSVFGQTFFGSGTATALGQYSVITALITEIIGTAILLCAVLTSGNVKNGVGGLVVPFAVLAIGTSLGGPSGYAINPARDLAPRIFGAIVGTQGLFDGMYWLLVPVIGPLVGGVLGVLLFDAVVTPGLKKKAEEAAAAARGAAGRQPAA